MKYRTLRTAALVAVATCAAFAQDGNGTTTPPTPAQLAARLVARLTTLLDLTATQQASATTIFNAEFTSLETIKTSLQTAETTLTADIKSNNTSGISTDAKTIGALTQQQVEAKGTADAVFYALLTTAQQTKADTLKHSGFGAFGGRGPGGRGDFGGHGGH